MKVGRIGCMTALIMNEKRVFLTKHSPAYWRVTLNHPPLNVFGPKTIPQLNKIITAIETDAELKVVVFDSAIDGFFMTHYDFLAKVEETTSLPPGPTGLQPLPDMLVRLSRAPVVSIASIRGRATGGLRSCPAWCAPRLLPLYLFSSHLLTRRGQVRLVGVGCRVLAISFELLAVNFEL